MASPRRQLALFQAGDDLPLFTSVPDEAPAEVEPAPAPDAPDTAPGLFDRG